MQTPKQKVEQEARKQEAIEKARKFLESLPNQRANQSELIVATCLTNQAQFFTYNKQDFNYIKGLKLYKPT